MKIEDRLKEVDNHIEWQKRGLEALQEERGKMTELCQRYPNAHWINGALCLPNIWPQISRMRITRKGSVWPQTKVVARFLAPAKFAKDLNVYSYPYEQDIGILRYDLATRSYGLQVLNYPLVIPDNCPKKDAFLARIKRYFIRCFAHENLTLDNNSYDADEFSKHLVLL